MAGFFLTLWALDKSWQLKTKARWAFSATSRTLPLNLSSKFKARSGHVYSKFGILLAFLLLFKATSPKLVEENTIKVPKNSTPQGNTGLSLCALLCGILTPDKGDFFMG